MKYRAYLLILSISSCILQEGCDLLNESDGTGIKKGTCEVRISGYIEKTFSGQAIFDNIHSRGHTLFFLILNDVAEPGKNYRIVEFQGGQPEVGTHSLINWENTRDSMRSTLIGYYEDSDVEEFFKSLGGNIEISLSTDKELKGTADFSASAIISLSNGQSTRAEIRVITRFYAEQGKTGIIID